MRPNSNPELQPIPDVRILANHSRLQAVFHPEREIWQCVFYVPGALSVGGFELRMNHPGLLMLQKDENGLQVCVSDPTQMLEKLIVSLSGQWTGPGCRYEAGQGITHVEFTLPPGGAAGQSVKRSLFSKK
ncbi:MAG: polysaccharide lyase beta-sandwich domain-containing protein [candidate division KSB1 bacterium]|nr:polysaccharide lyase beta-sandwich domain-containing protein [candidate division KSB1 bacterium]